MEKIVIGKNSTSGTNVSTQAHAHHRALCIWIWFTSRLNNPHYTNDCYRNDITWNMVYFVEKKKNHIITTKTSGIFSDHFQVVDIS